jgi:G3E family GTPase
LVEALKRLHKRMDKFDGVIIETTGLADPWVAHQYQLILLRSSTLSS